MGQEEDLLASLRPHRPYKFDVRCRFFRPQVFGERARHADRCALMIKYDDVGTEFYTLKNKPCFTGGPGCSEYRAYSKDEIEGMADEHEQIVLAHQKRCSCEGGRSNHPDYGNCCNGAPLS